MLNRYDESGHPCLVLHLRGKAFSFLLLSMILTVCHLWLFMWRYISSIPTFVESFIINWCWFVNAFLIYCDDHVIFTLHFVIEMCHIDIKLLIMLSCVPRINPTWSQCMILLYILGFIFCLYFFKGICKYIHQVYWPAILFFVCVHVVFV